MKPKHDLDLDLTKEEQRAFEEIRKRVLTDVPECISNKDYFIYRFLKARSFDVNKAEIMLRNHFEWRQKHNVDRILEEYTPKEVFRKYFQNLQFGYDKEDCPVFYLPVGKTDVRGILLSLKEEDIIYYLIHLLELTERILEERSKELNKRIEHYTYVDDMQDLSFASATNKRALEIFTGCIMLLQDNYPERLKGVYVLNASSLFTIPFSLLKPFIATSVREKVKLFGTVGWKEELLKLMEADKLPAFLGGTLTDPDGNPLCPSIVNQGGKIDEKYYIHKKARPLAGKKDAKKLVLSRASFSEIDVDVEEDESAIEWEFETKTRDIGFGLFYKEIVNDEEKITELVSLQRIDTEEFPETGIYKCEKAGTHVLLFDNSYSWIRSKEISYRVKVVPLKDQLKEYKEFN